MFKVQNSLHLQTKGKLARHFTVGGKVDLATLQTGVRDPAGVATISKGAVKSFLDYRNLRLHFLTGLDWS